MTSILICSNGDISDSDPNIYIGQNECYISKPTFTKLLIFLATGQNFEPLTIAIPFSLFHFLNCRSKYSSARNARLLPRLLVGNKGVSLVVWT
jgi:hypothetical protein